MVRACFGIGGFPHMDGSWKAYGAGNCDTGKGMKRRIRAMHLFDQGDRHINQMDHFLCC